MAGSCMGSLQALALLLILQGVIAEAIFVHVNQSGCHSNNVMLNCPSYNQSGNTNSLRWRFNDSSTGVWRELAVIRRGKANMRSVTQFDGRITLHSNGSLEIKSLESRDETHYVCMVSAIGRRDIVRIELAVLCDGKTTIAKREVCVEEEVSLDCQSKHRTNPKNLKKVTWHRKNGSGSWSRVASSDSVQLGHYKLHNDNGSLVFRAGRKVGVERFRCAVSKTTGGRDERHIITMTSINCKRQKRQIAANSKTTTGRNTIGVVTTATTITMATPTAQAKKVCGGNLTGVTGGFQSPNFPSAYPANSYCKWTISVPQDYAAIDITFEQMNLENEKHCMNDYIAIYDELGNEVGCRRCGVYRSALTTKVLGRRASVVFKSDATEHRTGFKISYKGVKDAGKTGP